MWFYGLFLLIYFLYTHTHIIYIHIYKIRMCVCVCLYTSFLSLIKYELYDINRLVIKGLAKSTDFYRPVRRKQPRRGRVYSAVPATCTRVVMRTRSPGQIRQFGRVRTVLNPEIQSAILFFLLLLLPLLPFPR